jgi:hypothetical protein
MTGRSCLLVAFGVTVGVAAAMLSSRPTDPQLPPEIEVREGHVQNKDSLRVLHPQSIRLGDQVTRLGQASPATPDLVQVYMKVNGIPVIIDLAIGRSPVAAPPVSDLPPRPVIQS